jgi:hypothetical protein
VEGTGFVLFETKARKLIQECLLIVVMAWVVQGVGSPKARKAKNKKQARYSKSFAYHLQQHYMDK